MFSQLRLFLYLARLQPLSQPYPDQQSRAEVANIPNKLQTHLCSANSDVTIHALSYPHHSCKRLRSPNRRGNRTWHYLNRSWMALCTSDVECNASISDSNQGLGKRGPGPKLLPLPSAILGVFNNANARRTSVGGGARMSPKLWGTGIGRLGEQIRHWDNSERGIELTLGGGRFGEWGGSPQSGGKEKQWRTRSFLVPWKSRWANILK